MKRILVRLLAVLITLLSLAAQSAELNALTELEEKLLTAKEVSFSFSVTAQGAVTANLTGTVSVNRLGRTNLTVEGDFAGQTLSLALYNDQGDLRFGPVERMRTTTEPAQLSEALIIGITRMGILHNIARLSASEAPDHAEGGVQDWVTVNGVVAPANSRRINFNIVVADEPSGSASVLLDPFGMIVKRDQTVEFPQGEMVVVERYSNLQISY